MSSINPYVLAIDLGTSGLKVALVSTRGEIAGYEVEPMHFSLLPGGGAEQSPGEWWDAVKRAARRLIAKGLVPAESIVAVCCTTQWSGTVPVDRSGAALANAIIWMDSRGAEQIRRVVDGPVKVQGYGLGRLLTWLRLTGGVPGRSGKDSIAHILYLKAEHPSLYRDAYKFLEPKDYLNLCLTGRFAAAYDSIILHWVTDNRKIDRIVYHDGLLAMVGVDRDKLPDLKPTVDVLGPVKPDVAAELGLGRDVQVVMGTPDVHSAAIGSGGVRNYQAHIYLGTSSWLSFHVPYKKTDLFNNTASIPSAIPGQYLVINEQECAAGCLNYLKDNIFYHADDLATGPEPADVYEIFNRVAARVPAGSGRLIFTPWLYGERAPVEDSRVRGGFFNQSLDTTREHLVRAVFEGVAYNTRWLLRGAEKFAGRRLDGLPIVGGGARSSVWCQVYADVLDRTVKQVADPVLANVRGAAFLAAVALRQLTFDQVPDCVPIAGTYTPNPDNRKIYDELFGEFVNIYKANRAIYARLNA